MSVSTFEIIDRVNRGAELLDKKSPGWEDRIKIPNLNMADSCLCVLGQIFKTYSKGLDTLLVDWNNAEHMGFYIGPLHTQIKVAYVMLDHAWVDAIVSRRNAAIKLEASRLSAENLSVEEEELEFA